MVKNLPATQETQVRSLGQEDPLTKRKATHSSILAWRIPWTEEPGGLQTLGSQKVRREWRNGASTELKRLHASGEGERVIAPEPWEGSLASRRVEEGLSRSFPG